LFGAVLISRFEKNIAVHFLFDTVLISDFEKTLVFTFCSVQIENKSK